MTGSRNHSENDAVERRRDVGVSSSPLVADGGPMRQLFDRFPDPIVYYELERDTAVVRAVNPAFERAFDVDEAAITDAPLPNHLLIETAERESDSSWALVNVATNAENGEPDAEAILERLAEGERVTVEFRRGTDDERRYFRLEDVSASDANAGGYIVYTTVTELLQEVHRATTRVDRLDRVVSIMAHDLRNPLDVADIRLEAARDTGEDVHFEKVEGALDRIQQIVQDALSVGGEEIDPCENVALEDVAEAAWTTVDTADAALVLEDHLPTIEADADSLQQAFENLFRNAVEHGDRDVTVTVGGLPGGFYVADDGPGVPSTDRERVFEPGYSSEDDNTGLGLAIVREVANDHGWRVAVDDSDAGGARFEFLAVETDGSE